MGPSANRQRSRFLTGIRVAGNPTHKERLARYVFMAEKSMPSSQASYSADGDFLLGSHTPWPFSERYLTSIVAPQQGSLDLRTEMGYLRVRPNEICVVPRGIRFHVSLATGPVRGSF